MMNIQLGDVTKNLLIINILAFISVYFLLEKFSLLPYFCLVSPGSLLNFNEQLYGFQPYQLVTSMFMHADFQHLIFNMLGLYLFGSHVERLLNPKRYFILYFTAGIIGGVAQMLMTTGYSLGASGAVTGVNIAFATMLPNIELNLMFIPIPIKAKYLAIGLVIYSVYAGFMGQDQIGYFAHLGGAVVGFTLVMIWGLTKLR